jgi:hypothetical protein
LRNWGCENIPAAFLVDPGGKYDFAPGEYRGYAAGLLIACNHFVYGCKIQRGAQDLALLPIIASQKPKAIAPAVVNDVVYMPDGSLPEGIRHGPMTTSVVRAIDVYFISFCIVEVFAPVCTPVGCHSEVKGPGSTRDPIGGFKLSFARA